MKKTISYIAALAALFAMGSCQKEIAQPEVETPVVEVEYETVTFDVAAPSGTQTKTSYGETVTFEPELLVAVYLNDQTAGETVVKYLPDAKTEITRKSNTEWTVSVSLVKNYRYQIVFWAQRKNAPYAIDWKEGTITADYTVAANDITRDAFYNICKDYSVVEHQNEGAYSVKLSRPFAQINIGAADYSELVKLYEFLGRTESDLETAISTPEEQTNLELAVPSVFHVLTGVADTPAPIRFARAATTPTDDSYDLIDGANDIVVGGVNYTLVGTNYVFANPYRQNNPTANLMLTFAYNGNVFNINVPNASYARNYQTNIVGSFFTSTARFEVVIVPGFNSEDIIKPL